MTKEMPRCWCGHTVLDPFTEDYLHCPKCETLVLARPPPNLTRRIESDEHDLYGKNYYLKHLTEDYGYPDIESRTRADLADRCIYWLDSLLRYKKPGSRLLEIGCGPAASVALFRAAGFDATGLELSPWLADYARKTWDIPMLQGPLEDQAIEPESIDIITLFDVVEHLPDPLETLTRCRGFLAPSGIIVVQTPCYPEDTTYDDLKSAGHPFLEHLKPAEHLFLFSKTALQRILREAGFSSVHFEEPIFSHYDQYAFGGTARELRPRPASAPIHLDGDRTRRIVEALLTVYRRYRQTSELVQDRDRRLAELDTQLHEANETARRLLAKADERTATAEQKRAETEQQLQEANRRLAELDAQLRELNETAREALAKADERAATAEQKR
ncbi:MAG: methyltransferase domain-containing protein, partial [Verrucomicrobia bacterium]